MSAVNVDAGGVILTPVPSVATVLGWVGTGAGGQILMALGKGQLRTGQLTGQIRHFSERSVYRYAGQFEADGLIDRVEEGGVPSIVTLSLSEPGRSLYRLIRSFAATPLSQLPGEGRDSESWASLKLLGQMWGSGFAEQLSFGARSLTQLSRSAPEMSFHQVNRRVDSFITAGLLDRLPGSHPQLYELTDHARRSMSLVAAVGRWRHRHANADGAPGLTLREMATVLRATLPLTVLPQHAGKRIMLGVSGSLESGTQEISETLRGTIALDGRIQFDEALGSRIDGSATATLNTWFAALLDGNRGRIRVRGDLQLVDSLLTQLYDMLWGVPEAVSLV